MSAVTDPPANSPMVLNLFRLFVLRNISLVCQIAVIAIARQWLSIDLSLLYLGLILLFLGVFNVLTWLRIRRSELVSEKEFFVQLTIDVMAFAAVLYFSGGATNPFAWFFLLPLVTAATVLSRFYIWSMAALTVFCYSLLMQFHIPLDAHELSHNSGFGLHILGMWVGFVFSVVIIAYFVAGMAHSMRQRELELAKVREQALRDERIVSLGTLAAGAAHELGTPLATMAIVAEELQNHPRISGNEEIQGNVAIIHDQITRCKQALSIISASAGEVRAESGQLLEVDKYLNNLVNSWRSERPGVVLHCNFDGDFPSPRMLAERALDQAIVNILDNAADASSHNVELTAVWHGQQLSLEVMDRGPGISEIASDIAGKILFSTKEHGLGVGLFLAHAVIGRMGGTVSLSNRRGGGARTLVTLPVVGI